MADRRSDRLVYFVSHNDSRGRLISLEENKNIPFEIKRVFYIYDVPQGKFRAGHSHIMCNQVIVALCGSFMARVDNDVYILRDRDYGVLVSPDEIVTLKDFSDDAICLVLASEYYDEKDNIPDGKISIPVSWTGDRI